MEATSGCIGQGLEVTFISPTGSGSLMSVSTSLALLALVDFNSSHAGCYPAQCSKVEMANNSFLLGQKYGLQVVINDMDL